MAANPTYAMIHGRHPMGWQSSIDGMIEANVTCRASCSTCNAWMPVDLEKVKAAMGGDFCLWDRRPRCRTPGCDSRVSFHAKLPNGPMRLMRSF